MSRIKTHARILALTLCLVTLIPALLSCDSRTSPNDPAAVTTEVRGTEQLSGNLLAIDFSTYTLVRPEVCSSTLLSAASQLKKSIDSITGADLAIKDDFVKKGTELPDDAREIVVGATNRPQSTDALAGLSGDSFVIAVMGSRIVINGTTDYIIAQGMNYFVENYVRPNVTGIASISLDSGLRFVSSPYSSVSLIQGGKCRYTVVYSSELDPTADENGKVDYQVMLAQKVMKKINEITGAAVSLKDDWVKNGTDTDSMYEILIGTTSRPQSLEVRDSLGIEQYGIRVIGNKIVVTGWNEQSIGLAVDDFCRLLSESTVKDDKGDSNIILLSDYSQTASYSGWTVDIPAFEGGKLDGSVTCNHDQLEYYYTDATEQAFRDYRKKLEAAGYRLYCENAIEGNLFATYTNETNIIHAYYVKHSGVVRLITGALKSSPALPDNVSGRPEYTKVAEPAVTQMVLDYDEGDLGNCYILTLEDGSFIVFDGGCNVGKKDHIRLYNLLKKLNKRPDGKIVIAAWVLSHVHADHFLGFYQMCITYGTDIKVEQLICNTPDETVYYNSYNPNLYMENGTFEKAAKAVGGIRLVKPHTGMKFWVRNVEFEVLYTQEDLYPSRLNFFNESTMVVRTTVAGQSIIWLGDIRELASETLCKMYGDYLKSDIVQVAHHGWDGATVQLYSLIRAEVALWPCSMNQYKSQTAGTRSDWFYPTNYYLVNNTGLKEVFVADIHNVTLPLPYKAGSGRAVQFDVPLS